MISFWKAFIQSAGGAWLEHLHCELLLVLVFLTFLEEDSDPTAKPIGLQLLSGYTIAIFIAHVPDLHILASLGPRPHSKCFKTVEV